MFVNLPGVRQLGAARKSWAPDGGLQRLTTTVLTCLSVTKAQ